MVNYFASKMTSLHKFLGRTLDIHSKRAGVVILHPHRFMFMYTVFSPEFSEGVRLFKITGAITFAIMHLHACT